MVLGRRKSGRKKRKMSSGEMESDVLSSPESSVSSVSNNQFWEFLQKNSEEVISRILSNAGWSQCIADRDETVRELREENEQLQQRLAMVEGAVTRSELQIKKLEEKVTDLTARSMRDNIIIKNMDEEKNEDDSRIEEKVISILQRELKIPTAEMSKVSIERAHRIGKPNDNRKRHVVVKLNSKGKSVVMSHIKSLDKASPIKINEQFPPEVHANRDKLWPVFMNAKQEGKKTRWNLDKLQVDGKVINPPTDKQTDINLDITGEALKLRVKHTPVVSRSSNHLQGHIVDIKSTDDVMPALKALCSDSRIAGASSIMYAYRVGGERHSIHNWEDDGEWGSGKKIMEAIKGKNIYNQLVCVTRWSSGKDLGPARFEMIKELCDSAIELGTF